MAARPEMGEPTVPAVDEAAPVLLERDGKVSWITLNRPDKLNALRPSLVEALGAAIDAAEADEQTQVVVVTGNGRAFCSGGDLEHFRAMLDGGGTGDVVAWIRMASETLARLAACPKPVIAAVNGLALAGGLEIILCCDLVIAAADARIGDAHLRYGVLPGGGGAVRLVKKLPANAANWLLMTAETVDAEQMREWGLVSEVVPATQLHERVGELATMLSERSPLGLRQVKDVVASAVDKPIAVALEREIEAFAEYVGSEDFREGVTAFAEGREPRYRGC
jgi:enoyl-CoA hydratase/carnithine racemase